MQDELDEVVTTWISHRIRAKAGYGVIEGRPTLMYTFPEMYSAEDNLKAVDMDELALCKEECTAERLEISETRIGHTMKVEFPLSWMCKNPRNHL